MRPHRCCPGLLVSGVVAAGGCSSSANGTPTADKRLLLLLPSPDSRRRYSDADGMNDGVNDGVADELAVAVAVGDGDDDGDDDEEDVDSNVGSEGAAASFGNIAGVGALHPSSLHTRGVNGDGEGVLDVAPSSTTVAAGPTRHRTTAQAVTVA